jgi:hypothetical protein
VRRDGKVFELRLLDAVTARPLAEVPLQILTPAGDERLVMTDQAGLVRLCDLDPGSCQVTSLVDQARLATAYALAPAPLPAAARGRRLEPAPSSSPSHLVDVVRHRVRSGETPASIARQHDVPWETIALFNWGTADPAVLERHFRQTLGCTRRTPDGRALRFDDGDDPGILLVPRRWEARLAVGAAHELWLAPLRAVFLSLENEAGLALPGARYHVRFADGSERQGRLGGRGIARLDGVPALPFTVSYPDELELLAASFAASVRRALDEPATAPLVGLLMQSPEVVARAVALYDEHLDDLGGQGLAADIDRTITDPEARRPLLALCALAGLPITSPRPAAS